MCKGMGEYAMVGEGEDGQRAAGEKSQHLSSKEAHIYIPASDPHYLQREITLMPLDEFVPEWEGELR